MRLQYDLTSCFKTIVLWLRARMDHAVYAPCIYKVNTVPCLVSSGIWLTIVLLKIRHLPLFDNLYRIMVNRFKLVITRMYMYLLIKCTHSSNFEYLLFASKYFVKIKDNNYYYRFYAKFFEELRWLHKLLTLQIDYGNFKVG